MLKNLAFSILLNKGIKPSWSSSSSFFHQSAIFQKVDAWKKYNEKIYPPQSPEESPRPAFICHFKENIKYSPKKMWYIACFVRGMSVDEAIKQLQFVQKKGGLAVKETILEAQKKAVEEHDVEFKSNLWVSESFVGKGMTIKGLRRCARGRMTIVRYRYCHYFVTLEEGLPPKDYYYFRKQKSGEELLNNWLTKMRSRKITKSL